MHAGAMTAPLHGWGRYPVVGADVTAPASPTACAAALRGAPLIARGLGRSYGDSSLAGRVLSTRHLDHFLSFDPATGLLACAAGVSLDAIIRTFLPRGWFLPVTPGTRFVSVGGAIASDVHGKNHHHEGTFCEHVRSIELLLGNGERVVASPSEHADLFRATCGGMGLTGVILSASLALKPVAASDMVTQAIKLPSLDATLDAFETHAASSYSVAWIDCVAGGRDLGRSLLFLGEHAAEGRLQATAVRPRRLLLPPPLLNPLTIRAFNALYHGRPQPRGPQRVPLDRFFYPLDAIADWNRMYGPDGFVQYQFVVPKIDGRRVLRDALTLVSACGLGSFLAVLKLFGPANRNLLSFPLPGYTLALDFKAAPAVFELLDELDALVHTHGGRVYLAKDARMSAQVFRSGYPNWQEFEEVRARWHAHGRFASHQSRRLGLA